MRSVDRRSEPARTAWRNLDIRRRRLFALALGVAVLLVALSLVTLAEQMGETDLVGILRENLEQEERMVERVEGLSQQLGKQLIAA